MILIVQVHNQIKMKLQKKKDKVIAETHQNRKIRKRKDIVVVVEMMIVIGAKAETDTQELKIRAKEAKTLDGLEGVGAEVVTDTGVGVEISEGEAEIRAI